ncbi:hypothetical protein B0H11DRAFT_1913956 [Mycena galericulata]|nr:hypothetical protein B0H11DRAFT_1919881 [Mycena galericulata]KAJ7486248.1 hypothetical protein B0H11DRAFT_1913956 [Mycena galericulata]
MTNLPTPAASATEPLGSVALAALSAGAPTEHREAARAALQYLATLYNLTPVAPASNTVAPPASAPVSATPAPATSAAPSITEPTDLPATIWTAGTLYNEVPTAHLAKVRDNGEGWYAVIRGRAVGVTQDNALALSAVLGVSNNSMKSHKTLSAALFYFDHALDIGLVEILGH